MLDTALVRVSPQAYNEVIETYKTPSVGLREIGLVAERLTGPLPVRHVHFGGGTPTIMEPSELLGLMAFVVAMMIMFK